MKLYEKESRKQVPDPLVRPSQPVQSYREVLETRAPHAVDERVPGGAFGCPGDYFRGAPAADCRPLIQGQCGVCWNGDYGNEEWIDNGR